MFWEVIIILLRSVVCFARMNVLFLVADDMRPEIRAYQPDDFPTSVHPGMHSYNLNKLASKSLLLKRAYCQQAICSPSRSSLLTGRRPDTTHVYDLETFFRNSGGNFTTIPQYFKNHGYKSIGMGKIFHPGAATGNNDPLSWSEPYFKTRNYGWETHAHSWAAIPDSHLIHKPLVDQQIASGAIDALTSLAPKAKTGEEPFFLAVGFHKPHLPFVFPESMLHWYPQTSIHLPSNPYVPSNMPRIAYSINSEISVFNDIPASIHVINSTLPDSKTKELRRAYYSSITYVDGLIGKVLHQLESLGLENNTIVSFIGDHGYQLGEHAKWTKHTNFDIAIHAPMMIRIPGKTDSGIQSRQMTELVDLFPTLVDAAGLHPLRLCPHDSKHVRTCREGSSMMPLIDHPTRPWKEAAFSQYPRTTHHTKYMGYTVRTDQYRYTEWVKFNAAPTYTPDWTNSIGTELYDHSADPEENHNVAGSSHYTDIQHHLSATLHIGWRGSLVEH